MRLSKIFFINVEVRTLKFIFKKIVISSYNAFSTALFFLRFNSFIIKLFTDVSYLFCAKPYYKHQILINRSLDGELKKTIFYIYRPKYMIFFKNSYWKELGN
jgi:hypothetical protein